MKKILGLLLMVMVASCSDDDTYQAPPEDTTVLLRKMVVNGPNGSETTTFDYNGNKLMTVTHSNGSTENYNYSGDALAEIRHYMNGGLVQKDTYLYDNTLSFAGYLSLHYNLQNPAQSYAERFDYTFSGQQVTIKKYTGNESQQNDLVETKVLTLDSNNIVKSAIEGGATTEYAFDYKNTPMGNMLNYNLYVLTKMEGGIRNITGYNTDSNITLITYTYTDTEYPATATYTNSSGTYTTTYTY